jgi:hypothetical protein
MGHEYLNRGILGEVKTGRNAFQAELRGLTQHLQQQMVEVVQPSCIAMFGDAKCKKSIAMWSATGHVTGVLSNQSFLTDLGDPINYYSKGRLTWTSGANTGLGADIKFFGGQPNYTMLSYTSVISSGALTPTMPSGKTFARDNGVVDSTGVTFRLSDTPSSAGTYEPNGGVYYFNTEDNGKTVTITYSVMDYTATATGQIDLQLVAPYDVNVGDTFTAIAGCDKLFSTCTGTFQNAVNFRGFPHLPGRDRLISGKS